MKSFLKIFFALVFAFTVSYAYGAWTEPSATPPTDNASTPINIGTGTQIKNGNLGVNTLSALQICLGADVNNQECKSMWPSGGGGGGMVALDLNDTTSYFNPACIYTVLVDYSDAPYARPSGTVSYTDNAAYNTTLQGYNASNMQVNYKNKKVDAASGRTVRGINAICPSGQSPTIAN